MKIKISNLIGPALDWAVAIAKGWSDVQLTGYGIQGEPEEVFFRPAKIVDGVEICGSAERWQPSTNWAQGGPIIKQECISIQFCRDIRDRNGLYIHAEMDTNMFHGYWYGSHDEPLVAAMRCYVRSKFYYLDEIDVPDCLIQHAIVQ